MTILKRAGWLLAVALATTLAAGAQSQQPAPKPEEKKPVKKKKVWTQDDLAGLRTARDQYADKKAAEEAAAKAAAEAAAKPEGGEAAKTEDGDQAAKVQVDPATGKPYLDPDSPEGMEDQLKKWEASLPSIETQLTEARSRLAQTTDPQRWDTAKLEVELLEQNLTDTRQRIEELKGKIAAAKAAKPEGAPKPPTPPPSQ